MTSRYDAQLRPRMRSFYLLTLLLVLVLSVSAFLHRSIKALEATAVQLKLSTDGLVRMHVAINNRKAALSTLKSQLKQENGCVTPERIIYGKADEIKSRFKAGTLSIAPIERTPLEASLPYTITVTNARYATFLQDIGYLQNSVFPFAPTSEITIAQTEEQGIGAVTFTIKGAIRTPLRDKP